MKLHEFFFWLLVFFLPTQLGKHFWPDFSLVFGLRVDYLSPTIYLTDLLVIGILGAWAVEKFKTTKKNTKIFCFLFPVFCFLLANSFLAQNQGAALYKFVKIIEFSLLGLYVAKNNHTLYAIRYMLPLAVIYSSLIAIFQFFKQTSFGGIFYWLGERSFNIQTPGIALADLGGRLFLRPYGTFSHPNSMAGFLLVSLILISAKKINRAATGLGTVVILLSFSRAVWLVGAPVGLWLMAYGLWKREIKKKILFLTIGCLLVAILAGLSFPEMGEKPVVERIQLIHASFEMIKSNPVSGVGLNNFIVRLPEYWQEGSVRILQPVHNIYLLIASETGLVGLAIFLWFLILTYKKLLITNYYCEAASYAYLLITALSAILALGLFDHYWFTLQQNQLLFVIVVGLSWSKIKER